MLAIISKDSIGADFLKNICISSGKSLLKQSFSDKLRRQEDGWGIGYYIEKKPFIFKSEKAIFNEKELFEKKIKAAENSKIFIAHIRDASNPKKLPHKKLISRENSQPFFLDNIVFAHNGTLFICDEIYSNLGKYKKYVKGVNDSEILFWEFIKILEAYGDISVALKMLKDEIKTVWFSIEKDLKNKGINTPYRGLNIFVSDGNELFAMEDYELKPQKYSIMTHRWKWGKYALKRENGKIIIASEPCDNSQWEKAQMPIITMGKNGKIDLAKEQR